MKIGYMRPKKPEHLVHATHISDECDTSNQFLIRTRTSTCLNELGTVVSDQFHDSNESLIRRMFHSWRILFTAPSFWHGTRDDAAPLGSREKCARM